MIYKQNVHANLIVLAFCGSFILKWVSMILAHNFENAIATFFASLLQEFVICESFPRHELLFKNSNRLMTPQNCSFLDQCSVFRYNLSICFFPPAWHFSYIFVVPCCSIPFSTEDIYMALPAIDPSLVELPMILSGYASAQFLVQPTK